MSPKQTTTMGAASRGRKPSGINKGIYLMNQKSGALVHKVWNYAHVLKDDGLAFMDYTEQITYLLFLKMVKEQRQAGVGEIPTRYSWDVLKAIPDNTKRLERYHQGLRRL